MKNKPLKFIKYTVLTILLCTVVYFANAFVGNPVSKLLAANTAKNHLAQTYPGTDYQIESTSYNFKDGKYHSFVTSPTSIDTEFSISTDMFGRFRYDTFDSVENGFNTASRLDYEYRQLTDTVLEAETFPYSCHIAYATLEIYPEEAFSDPTLDEIPVYAINQSNLVIDKLYDIRKLGEQAGHLILYIEADSVSPQKAAEIILNIRSIFDEAEIPFVAMDFTLWYPQAEDGSRPDGEILIRDFPYSDIYAENMTDRIGAADKATKEYYAKRDAENEKLYGSTTSD